MILKEIPRITALFKLVCFLTWIIRVARLTSEMFSHTSPSKRVSAIFHMWFAFCFTIVIINADVPFCKRGHNLEMDVKLNKARHPFSNEVSLNVGADFHLISSEDVHKWTKNVHPCMQFYFIEKTTKNVLRDFYDQVLKSPLQWQMSAWFILPQQWLMTTWNKQTSTILVQNPSQCLIIWRTKYQELWKGLYVKTVNCCNFFYAGDFVGRIGIMLLNLTPLRFPDMFYNHASRSQKGKILRWNKNAGQQADLAS